MTAISKEELLANVREEIAAEARRKAARLALRPDATEYDTGIVTYLDVLGFRILLKDRAPSDIMKIQKTVEEVAGANDESRSPTDPRVLSFSDSIVRVRPVGPDQRIGLLFYELLDLVHAQARLMLHGVLVRGGIAIGAIHIDALNAFGPALVDAYEIEANVALYPRIAISPSLLASLDLGPELIAAHHDREDEKGYILDLVSRGDDGIWYVDYLRAMMGEYDTLSAYAEFLSEHRQLIMRNLTHENLSSIALKYNWLMLYHNRVVNALEEEFFDAAGVARANLQIPGGSSKTCYDFGRFTPSR